MEITESLRISLPFGPLPYVNSSIKKDGPGPVMVSDTLRPAVHILGT